MKKRTKIPLKHHTIPQNPIKTQNYKDDFAEEVARPPCCGLSWEKFPASLAVGGCQAGRGVTHGWDPLVKHRHCLWNITIF